MQSDNAFHDHPEEVIDQAIRGELREGDRAILERHLSACPTCSAQLELVPRFAALLSPTVRGDALNRAAVEQVISRVGARAALRSKLRRSLQRAAFAAAAGFGIVLALSHVRAPARPTASNSANDPRPILLPDGSEIVPRDGATTVRVTDYAAEHVTVRLESGGARFRVGHDERRVFRVAAGPMQIEDLGTVFRVDYEPDSRIRVAVTEGRVAVVHVPTGRRVELGIGEQRVFPEPADSNEPQLASNAPAGNTPEAQAASSINAPPYAEPRSRSVNEQADLLAAADAARRAGQPQKAVLALRRFIARYPKDPRAPSAAFTLGLVLLNDLKLPRDAANAFLQAERGALAEDAAARAVEAWHRAGDSPRAAEAARHYEQVYPTGRYVAVVRSFSGEH